VIGGTGVETRLVVDGADSAAALASLNDWLRRSGELRGRVKLVAKRPEPGQMGAVGDVLAIAVGGGGALTVLANSLSVWLRQPRRSKVSVHVVKPDGVRVEIRGENLRSADEIAGLLGSSLHPGQDD
jgi:Effector Associated Constant Component 1